MITIKKIVKANAKINIGLNVLRKREDNYHDLDMLMLPIDLCDEIEIDFLNEEGDLIINSSSSDVPNDKSNIIYKIYDSFYEYTKLKKEKIYVNLKKNIPSQAGLGGGSSDGAFFLNALNDYYNKVLSISEMIRISKNVGSDVPFFIINKSARIKNTGDLIEEFNSNILCDILLIKPSFGVSTARAYSLVSKLTNKKFANIDNIQNAIENNSLKMILENIENTLEQALLLEDDNIISFRGELEKLKPISFFMSGSGSCYFALIEKEKSQEIYEKAKTIFKDCIISLNKFL